MTQEQASLWLDIAKFAGIALSGIFGAISLATEVRNKRSGRFTRWGRLSLVGLAVSTALAAFSEALEIEEGVEDARQTSKRNTIELHEIARAVSPLQSMSFFYRFDIDPVTPEFLIYRRRAEGLIEPFLKNLNSSASKDVGLEVSGGSTAIPGRVVPYMLTIAQKGPAYPRQDRSEILALDAVQSPAFTIAIYRLPRDFDPAMCARGDDRSRPDLSVQTTITNSPTLNYDVKAHEFYLIGSQADKRAQLWENDGGVASTLDFAGSQLVVCFDTASTGSGLINLPYIIDVLNIDLGHGQRINIHGYSMRRHTSAAAYDVVLPKELLQPLPVSSGK